MKKLITIEKDTLNELNWLKQKNAHLSLNAIICEAIRRMAAEERRRGK